MHEVRPETALLLVLAWAAPSAAGPVGVGAAARGEAHGEPAAEVSLALARMQPAPGEEDGSTGGAALASAETASSLARDTREARELYGRAEFERALSVIDAALERFETEAAFSGDEAAWTTVQDLLALRALTLARVDREREERATVRRLLALRPEFQPDPGDFPPGFVERVEKERAGLSTSDGTLRVESSPDGARVRVDGREVGVTPVSLDSLPAGVHFVAVEGDGDRHEQRVTLDDSDITVRARFREAPPGGDGAVGEVADEEPVEGEEEGDAGAMVAAAVIGGGAVLVVGAVVVGAVVAGRLEAERGFYVRLDTSGL